MLYIFRVDIGETYTFETDLAFQEYVSSPPRLLLLLLDLHRALISA